MSQCIQCQWIGRHNTLEECEHGQSVEVPVEEEPTEEKEDE